MEAEKIYPAEYSPYARMNRYQNMITLLNGLKERIWIGSKKFDYLKNVDELTIPL